MHTFCKYVCHVLHNIITCTVKELGYIILYFSFLFYHLLEMIIFFHISGNIYIVCTVYTEFTGNFIVSNYCMSFFFLVSIFHIAYIL